MNHSCNCATHAALAKPTIRTTAEQTVAEVSRRPGALEVFQRLGINHCCGAHLSLREAAAAAGVPVDDLLHALDDAAAVAP